MPVKRSIVYIFSIFFLVYSCKKDEEILPPVINDYSDQLIKDSKLLEYFLKSHFYNYEDFQENSSSYVDIKIDTISGSNSNKISLFKQVNKKVVSVIDSNNASIDHTLYYLLAKKGVRAQKPSLVDSVYLKYEGKLLNGYVFDQRSQPIWFDLSSVIQGFRHAIQEFSPGNYEANSDGTVSFEDFGQGMFFLPSGLGYFSNTQTTIPEYSPLIFKISLFTINITDHDSDGILSINEDIDGDGDPMNDDSDNNSIPNLYDNDDDGDGILTKDEYDQNNDGIPDDSDLDSIPDYLDIEG
tara:strand:+ start:337 stop:1227 length:891 start_codon:yes stop_codon:yes gene_type:complete